METTGLVTNNLAEDHLPVNLFWNQNLLGRTEYGRELLTMIMDAESTTQS